MRLLELREERNLSQLDIADAINTSRTNIGRWEKGTNEPSSSALIALADYFECSIDYLLGREDDFGNIVIRNDKTTATLTADEQSLLDTFRKLNTKNRMHVAAYAEVRLEEQEKGNLRA